MTIKFTRKALASYCGAVPMVFASMVLPASSVSASGLEEVIVSATRRAESMQNVPLAVSAVTGEQLTKSGIFETSDLNRSAPNLQVSSAYGEAQPNFSIRGVGVGTEYNANAASPVGVYVDQVYQTFRPTHGQQLFDMEQIEVVRGPQGTLYGRNTTGGAVNFITKKPQLEGSNGNVTVGFGNYNRKNLQGAYEFTPSEGTFGVRIAGSWVETDPYVENKLPAGLNTFTAGGAAGTNFSSGKDPGGYENYGVRATFRFAPNDDTDVMLKVYKAESDGNTEVPIATGSSKNSDVIDWTKGPFLFAGYFNALNGQVPGVLPQSYSKKQRGLGLRDVEVDGVGQALIEAEGIVLTTDIGLNENLSFIGVFGYDSGEYHQDPTTDCDATPLNGCTIGYNSDFDAYNVDVRFDYQDGPLKLIAGAFYGEDSIVNDNKPNFFNFLNDANAAVLNAQGVPAAAAQQLAANYFNPAGNQFNGTFLSNNALLSGFNGEQHNKQERESWAIYGELNYAFTDTLNLTVGLRYSDDTLKYSEGRSTFFDAAGTPRLIAVSALEAPFFLADVCEIDGTGCITADTLNTLISGTTTRPADLERDGGSDSISGRVILDWHASEETMLYASYSRGYRAGTMNGLSYASAAQVYFVPEEEVDAYEFGFKSRLMDGRLQLNGSLFYYDYAGQQGQVVDSTATAFLVSLDGEVKGLELDAKFAATDKLTLTAAVGILDTEYDDGDCSGGIPAGDFQKGNCVGASAGPVNVGGNPFPYAAEETVNLGFDWDIAQFESGYVTLHGDAAYTGQYYFDTFEDYSGVVEQNMSTGVYGDGEGDFWTLNGRLSYIGENVSVGLWGKNLTDEEFYGFGISIENLFGNGYRMLAPPRTYGVDVSYKF